MKGTGYERYEILSNLNIIFYTSFDDFFDKIWGTKC
jgi:hypothetical protein